MAGVSASHCQVSQTRPTSALSSAPCTSRKEGSRCRTPLAGLDEGHHLALVVRGAAGDDDFPGTGVLGKTRREGRRGPLLQRIRRLHVVVAVKQDA
jgi:hypothetical protein